jgi:hypothetical protein
MKFDTAAFWIRMYDLPLVCMGREMGFKLGSTVGKVERVETDGNCNGWGEFLRVRAHVNLTKPIPRGRVLKLKNQSLWVPFKYERLPKLCLRCGVISHGEGGCSKESWKGKQEEGSEDEYGSWLRVSSRRPWTRKNQSRLGANQTEEFSESTQGWRAARSAAETHETAAKLASREGNQLRKDPVTDSAGSSINACHARYAENGEADYGEKETLMKESINGEDTAKKGKVMRNKESGDNNGKEAHGKSVTEVFMGPKGDGGDFR